MTGIRCGPSAYIHYPLSLLCLWYRTCMLCCVEQAYQSAVSQINDIRRKKALLNAHAQQAKETVVRVEEFTKQIRHRHELLSELHRYDCIDIPRSL